MQQHASHNNILNIVHFRFADSCKLNAISLSTCHMRFQWLLLLSTVSHWNSVSLDLCSLGKLSTAKQIEGMLCPLSLLIGFLPTSLLNQDIVAELSFQIYFNKLFSKAKQPRIMSATWCISSNMKETFVIADYTHVANGILMLGKKMIF